MNGYPKTKLSDVAELNPTRPRALSQFPDYYLVTFVPMPAVDQFSGTISSGEIRKLIDVKKGFTYFEDGDVIFAKITPCMQNGKSAIAVGLENKVGFGSTEFHVIRANPAKILPEWIWYFVRRLEFRTQGTFHFRGAVGQQRVPVEYLENAQIPLPPLDEQRRIVGRIKDCLSRVEEIERLRQESERETDQLHSAIFADFVNSQLVDVSSVALGTVLKECKYGTSVKANVSESGFPVLRMGNIKEGRLDITDLKHIDLPSAELEKYFLSDGDILVNRTNSFELVGKSALFESLTGDWVYASYLIRLRVHTDAVLPEYVNGIINSRIGRAYVMRTARRAIGMVNINAEEIKRMPLPLPSLSIQRELVEKLKCAAPVIDRLSSEIDKKPIEGFRESILRKAFAGEL